MLHEMQILNYLRINVYKKRIVKGFVIFFVNQILDHLHYILNPARYLTKKTL